MRPKFVRLERPATGSWITIQIPLAATDVYEWIKQHYPEWDVVSLSPTNPDND